MKSWMALALTFAASGTLFAADAPGSDDVKGAAQKLAAADNYSWTTTIESQQFRPGPSHGKTEKGGYTYVDFTFQDNTIEAVVKDKKGAIKTEDGWESLTDAAKGDGGGFNPSMFIARRMQNFKSPATEAEELAGKTKAIAKADDAYAGDLTGDGAKSLLTFGRRGGNGGQPPAVKDPKGSVKFWVKGGILTKYQYKVEGTVNRDGEDVQVGRTTTVEIKDVGATKVSVPDEAKSKMM